MKLNVPFIGLLLFSIMIVPTGGRAEDYDTFRVTLLGSGIPVPSPDRFGPSTLVEAGGHKMLFDAGRGATVRLFQLHVRIGAIEPLFLTHFHSDHTVGITAVWLTGWLGGPFGRRKSPFRVIGPIGAKELMQNLERAYAADVRIRIVDEKYPPEGAQILVEEFVSDGVVYDKDGVRVSAFEVDHGDAIKPAYGYRIEFRGRSAVISGDTRYNENVVRYATGADLLIHEVGAVQPTVARPAGAACHGASYGAPGGPPCVQPCSPPASGLHAPGLVGWSERPGIELGRTRGANARDLQRPTRRRARSHGVRDHQ